MSLPPPPINDVEGTYNFKEWLNKIYQYVGGATGLVPWSSVSKTGSNLADLATKNHSSLSAVAGSTDGYHTSAGFFNTIVQYLTGGSPGYGWRDLIGEIVVKGSGLTDPDWNTYRSNIKQYQFKNTGVTEVTINYHIQHDYKPGSDLYLHVHWSQIVVDTGGTAGAPGQAKWYFDVSYAKGHQQAAFSAPITTSVTQTASSTQYMHNIAEVQLSASSPSASQLDSDNIEVDGVIIVRLYRDPSDVADTLDQRPFVHYVDMHYQTDRISTKNKAPDFYN